MNDKLFCDICKSKFYSFSNLNRHRKQFHSKEVDDDHVAPYKCNECGKFFKKNSYLKIHIKKYHAGKFNELFPQKSYNCNECGKQFTHKVHCNSHLKQHSLDQSDLKIKCPLCPYQNSKTKKLILHYENDHTISFQIENFEFDTMEDLYKWKTEMEKKEKSRFVRFYHSKNKTNEKIKYVCHRSGSYTSKGQNIRHLKTQGSNKINGLCPANMSVTVKNNKCVVNFQRKHVGHDTDLGHLQLTNIERQEIGIKIAAKIPFQTILDGIRDSLVNSNLERIHLLTRKDLFNIEQAYNMNGARHKNDLISVESWICEMNDNVLYYKPQNIVQDNFRENDFILCIMTNGQKEIMEQYCTDCVCVDGTHGLNSYGFQLHTILVLNSLREGFPCAFLVSSRSDEEVLSHFFFCVKEKLGFQVRPKVFMSDMAPEYYNAWLRIMQPADSRLYCTWHIDRAWRKNLSKIDSKERQVFVYKNLRMLLQETDMSAFLALLEEFKNILSSDEATMPFLEYFNEYYVPKKECWAYCYRVNTGLTNMHIERLHKTIKYLYLDGKHVKRLDIAINAIMKFVRDKLFEVLIVDYKGKLCTKIKILRERHIKSSTLDANLVVRTEHGWQVASSCHEIYSVEKRKNICDGCKLVCNECEACLHQYSCTCIDSCIKWNMCKHIHLVCRSQRTLQTHSTEIDDVGHGKLEIYLGNIEAPNSQIIQNLSKANTQVDLNTKKERLKTSVFEVIANINSSEQFEAIEKIFAPAKPTLMAIQNNEGRTNVPNSIRNIPHNKKIVQQPHFVTTKKK